MHAKTWQSHELSNCVETRPQGRKAVANVVGFDDLLNEKICNNFGECNHD